MRDRTVLTLARHGETSANLDKVWHGSTDTPLTDRGRLQAQRLAEWTALHRSDATTVYASPLQRARDTATAVATRLKLDLRLDPDLAEFHLGDWEGVPFTELFHGRSLGEQMRGDPDFRAPNAESPRDVALRLATALQRIAAAHPGQRVIVVSHSAAMCLGLGWLLDGVPNAWNRFVENCAVCDLDPGPPAELLTFNMTEHLADLRQGRG